MILGFDQVLQLSPEMATVSGHRFRGELFQTTSTSLEPRSRHNAAGVLCACRGDGFGTAQVFPPSRLWPSYNQTSGVRRSAKRSPFSRSAIAGSSTPPAAKSDARGGSADMSPPGCHVAPLSRERR